MGKAKRTILAAACAAALVVGSVAATVAYLTSTDTVTNTFTVGNVAITLDEAKVNDSGKAVKVTKGDDGQDIVMEVSDLAAATRVKTNSYKLLPGHEYVKDPTVTVKAGSEESYVRMLVTVTFGKELAQAQLATKLDSIFTGYNSDWARIDEPKAEVKVNEDGSKYIVVAYEYRYYTTVEGEVDGKAADNKLPALFTGFIVPSTWTNEDLEAIGGFEIDVVAQAIQKDGFSSADVAWAAFPTDAS